MSDLFGTFIDPDRELETLADPRGRLHIPIRQGHRAIDHIVHLPHRNPLFDEICARVAAQSMPYEDQCSGKYYLDLTTLLQTLSGEYGRVVEVGVYMGGASAIFAGLMEKFDIDLDMIDINAAYLRYTYERIRRMFPEVASRIRLFYGTLPAYVKQVMSEKSIPRSVVHHDGAHDFTQVTKDLASLSFLGEKLAALIVQDTHLRGSQHMNFVDMALYAVFGTDLSYAPIGMTYEVGDPATRPNKFEGNYFVPGAPEGMVLPMAANRFHYPHPDMDLTYFL